MIVFYSLALCFFLGEFFYRDCKSLFMVSTFLIILTAFIISLSIFIYIFKFSKSHIDDSATRRVNIGLFTVGLTGSISYIVILKITEYSALFFGIVALFLILLMIELHLTKLKSFWHLAVHESCHTLVSEIEFPGSVLDVTFHKNGSHYSGYTHSEIDNENIYEKYLSQMRVFLAGGVGEIIFLHDDIKDKPEGDIEFVIETIRDIVNNGHYKKASDWDTLSDEEQEAVYSEFIKEQNPITRKILEEHAETIHKLALQLYRRDFVPGNEARDIILSASKNPHILS